MATKKVILKEIVDGEVGLYDLVNNRFLGNSGSGSLIGSDE